MFYTKPANYPMPSEFLTHNVQSTATFPEYENVEKIRIKNSVDGTQKSNRSRKRRREKKEMAEAVPVGRHTDSVVEPPAKRTRQSLSRSKAWGGGEGGGGGTDAAAPEGTRQQHE